MLHVKIRLSINWTQVDEMSKKKDICLRSWGISFYPGSFRQHCTSPSSSCVPVSQLIGSSMSQLWRSKGSTPNSGSDNTPISRHSWAEDKLKSPFSSDSQRPILFLTLLSLFDPVVVLMQFLHFSINSASLYNTLSSIKKGGKERVTSS